MEALLAVGRALQSYIQTDFIRFSIIFASVGIPVWLFVVANKKYDRRHPKRGTPEAEALRGARADVAHVVYHSPEQVGRAAADAALNAPAVVHDRWRNRHITTPRNRSAAVVVGALSSLVFVVLVAWAFHSGAHDDCTTTVQSSGSIGMTTHDITTCKRQPLKMPWTALSIAALISASALMCRYDDEIIALFRENA